MFGNWNQCVSSICALTHAAGTSPAGVLLDTHTNFDGSLLKYLM